MAGQDLMSSVDMRVPCVADAGAIRDLAVESGRLDVNSPYFYLVWCRDFSATSVVAWQRGGLLGFVLGYLRPDQPDTVYVWQVAVRVRGLGTRLIEDLLGRVGPAGVRFLEATVTESNHRSIAMFERLAERLGAVAHRSELFTTEQLRFGHEPELLLRIGPF